MTMTSVAAEGADLVALYRNAKPHTPQTVAVPPASFIAIDGEGEPESESFQRCIQAIYSSTYTLKFSLRAQQRDFKVEPLEGLWYGSESGAFDALDRDLWRWTIMLHVPDSVTTEDLEAAKQLVRKRHPDVNVDHVYLRRYHEGLAVQVMHIGPYAQELGSITELNNYATAHSMQMSGPHHEIYLGDPRRAAPDKLKTILRHPVAMN